MNALEIETVCKALIRGDARNAPLKWYRDYLRRADSYAVSYCPGLFGLIGDAGAVLNRLGPDPEDKPEPGRIYALTGGTGSKCILNGNTWAESEVH